MSRSHIHSLSQNPLFAALHPHASACSYSIGALSSIGTRRSADYLSVLRTRLKLFSAFPPGSDNATSEQTFSFASVCRLVYEIAALIRSHADCSPTYVNRHDDRLKVCAFRRFFSIRDSWRVYRTSKTMARN
jgi:hypothetical protein